MTGPGPRAAWHPFGSLLGDPTLVRLWAGRLLERSGDWILLVAALVLAWDVTGDPAAVAVLILVRVLPRVVLLVLGLPAGARRIATKLFFLMTPMRAALAMALALAPDAGGLPGLLAAVAAIALLWALSEAVRAESVAALVPRLFLGRAVMLNAATERVAMVVGPASAGLTMAVLGAPAALAAAGLLLAGASVLALGRSGLVARTSLGSATTVGERDDIGPARRPPWGPVAAHPTLSLMAAASFASGALLTSLTIALVAVVIERSGGPVWWLGWLLAVVGLGTSIGPVATARVLAHVPAPLLVTAAVIATALGVAVIGLTSLLIVVVVVLFALGLVAVNADAVIATVTRRLTPAERLADTSRAMLGACACGQATGALAVLAVSASRGVTDVLLILGVASVLLVGVLLLAGQARHPAIRQGP